MNELSKTIINDEYLAKCEEGEPIFALCGRDMHASGAVRYWAIAKMQKHGKDDPQAKDALKQADVMWDYWVKNHREDRSKKDGNK
jgi:hypothetical protein